MAEQIKIELDMDGLTWDDMVFLETMQEKDKRKATSIHELRDVLNRIVIGGVGKLPFSCLPDIADAINREVAKLSNPEDKSGKN